MTDPTKPSQFKRIYLISAGTLIAIMLVIAAINLLSLLYPPHTPDIPHPLGDKLEYIGRYEYGCNFLCGSHPGETYFYATDLTPPALVRYFRHASLLSPAKIDDWNESSSLSLELETPTLAKAFTIDFTSEGAQKTEQFSLRKTTKKYVISFDAQYYQAAKDSL